MSFSVNSDQDAFKTYFLQKQQQIINKLNEKKESAIFKIDFNHKRLLKSIPEEILNMPAGQFLDKYNGNYDEAFIVNMAMDIETNQPNTTYKSPPKKQTKKIIKKVKI